VVKIGAKVITHARYMCGPGESWCVVPR
jgi:hypothetical protein